MLGVDLSGGGFFSQIFCHHCAEKNSARLRVDRATLAVLLILPRH
jgi:hypothetical protein